MCCCWQLPGNEARMGLPCGLHKNRRKILPAGAVTENPPTCARFTIPFFPGTLVRTLKTFYHVYRNN